MLRQRYRGDGFIEFLPVQHILSGRGQIQVITQKQQNDEHLLRLSYVKEVSDKIGSIELKQLYSISIHYGATFPERHPQHKSIRRIALIKSHVNVDTST